MNEVRRNDLVACDVRVAQLDFDPIAQRRKHVREEQHLFPLRIVALDHRRLTLVNNHNRQERDQSNVYRRIFQFYLRSYHVIYLWWETLRKFGH